MRDTVYIAGHGKLASQIQKNLPEVALKLHHQMSCVRNWDDISVDTLNRARSVVVHVGSGKQFAEVLQFCLQHRVPLIQGSTGITYPDNLPDEIDFVLIDAPNLSIPMIKFLYLLEMMGPLFREQDISIIESHQSAKTSPPGTALEMARSLGVEAGEVRSIRDKKVQSESLGIPPEHLDQHAFHQIDIVSGGCTISLKTEVYGLETYVEGLAKIISQIDGLPPRRYTLADLVRQGVV